MASERFVDLEKKVIEHSEYLKKEIMVNLEKMSEDMMEKSKRISVATFKVIEMEPMIRNIQSDLTKYDKVDL